MRYKNEVGYRALELYADHDHVVTAKQLLVDIMHQLNTNCVNDGLDEFDVADHVAAGLLHLTMDVIEATQHVHGRHRFLSDVQDLAVEYGLSHLI